MTQTAQPQTTEPEPPRREPDPGHGNPSVSELSVGDAALADWSRCETPHLLGQYRPVHDEIDADRLEVIGELPPGLVGSYVFGDFMTGEVWRTSVANGWSLTKIPAPAGMMITTFGEDYKGELYLADYKAGTLYRFRTAPK